MWVGIYYRNFNIANILIYFIIFEEKNHSYLQDAENVFDQI